MPTRHDLSIHRPRVAAMLLMLVSCVTSATFAQNANKPNPQPTTRATQPETRATYRENLAAEYETIRMSKPDGSVVLLRVPKQQRWPGPVASPGRRPTTSGPTGRASIPLSITSELVPSLYGVHGVRISLPYTGTRTFDTGTPLGDLLLQHGGRSRVGTAAVAGDDPTEWRTGRGWLPEGEGGSSGDYIGVDPGAITPLVAGREFLFDNPPPAAEGEPTDPGYDAEVIARWDVVPHQTIAGDFEVGVVAFHMNGVDRVDMSIEGGPWVTLSEMQINPRTGVREYVAAIQAEDLQLSEDEEVELRAIAYPAGAGTPRLLDPLFLFVNNQGTFTGPTIHVAKTGNDSSGNGTPTRPYATIKRALNACGGDIDAYDGARILITKAGRYDIDQPAQPVRNTRWITIEADSSLSRDDVVIAAGSASDLVRPNTQRLRFHGVSFDFADMYQMYKEDPHQQWYDGCRWYYSAGWTYTPPSSISPVRNVGYGGLFVTDSLAEDALYGFINCNLVLNSHAQKISGDVFQNSLMVVQSSASLVDGTVLTHHSDILQYFGQFENLIVYNVNAAFVKATQNIFLDHANSSFTNCAFVNVSIQNAESDPPFSQLNSTNDHVLFYHIANPGQRFVLRDDMAGSGKFIAKNVIFRNSVVERIQASGYFDPIPAGVVIDHCHFNYNEPRGEDPTVGAIFLLNSSGGQFEYIGYGAGKIRGTATPIPGYSESETPDRGAVPWGLPR